MYYCRRCRLYFEEELEKCPLCGKSLYPADLGGPSFTPVFSTPRLPRAEDQESFWTEQKKTDKKTIRKRLFSIYFLMSIISILTLLGIDFSAFSESRVFILRSYTAILSIVFTFSVVLIIIHIKNAAIVLWSIGLSLSIFLVLLDLNDLRLSWAIPRGLPITWAVLFPSLLPVTFWYQVRIKGLNLVALFFIGLAVSLMLIGITVSVGSDKLIPGWSIIVFSVLAAIAVLFFYLHYVLRIHIYFDHLFKLQRTDRDIL